MPHVRPRPLAIAGGVLALILALDRGPTLAEDRPPTAAIPRPTVASGMEVPKRPSPTPGATGGSGPWWLGSVGVVAALAVVGWVSLASKRFLPSRESGPFQVVGRTALSPKHSVYLLRVGDRVLIVGSGPQGAPSTLGEVTDPVELARLAPRRTSRLGSEPTTVARPNSTFDHRIGGDE